MVSTLISSSWAHADEGDEDDPASAMEAVLAQYDGTVGYRTILTPGTSCSFDMQSNWQMNPDPSINPEDGSFTWGPWTDPVLGPAALFARLWIEDAPVATLDDLGKVQYVRPDKQLGRGPSSAFKAADILASKEREGFGGTKFLDFDLAIPNPPSSCNTALGCGNAGVELATVAISNGKLYCFSIFLNEKEWKQNQNPVRRVRSTFRVNASDATSNQ